MGKMFSAVKIWLPLAVATTMICGIVYITAQQNYRMNANDPQIQIAEVISARMPDISPTEAVGTNKVDLTSSLSTFVIIFDNDKKILASSAVLDGQSPMPPAGVFDYTRDHGQDRFTWQPKNGVRLATVLQVYRNGGFVLAGRSLREVERRINNLGAGVLLGWAFTLFCVLVITLIITIFSSKSENNN